MVRPFQPGRGALFLAFAMAFCLQCLPLIYGNSLTNDEPFEITSGCYYWKHGDVVTTRMQPPLAAALQTLPLMLTGLEWPHGFKDADNRAYQFFFVSNWSRLQVLTVLPRLMALLFGIGIGWLLWRACLGRSMVFTLSVLGFWALDPNLVAHSSIAKSDITLAFFFLASILAFSKTLGKLSWPHCLSTGLLTGMAITTKVTGLSLFVVYALLEAVQIATAKKRAASARLAIQREAILLAGALLWVFLIYLPGALLLPDHRNPLAYYEDKVATGWRIAQKGWAYFYFMGQASDVSHTFYLPVAFLLKSTLPFLILLFLGLGLWALRKISVPAHEWIPPLVVTLSVLPASNFGMRMMFPAFPFLFLMAARAAEWMWAKTGKASRKTFQRILAALGLWLIASLAFHFPHYLSYANESVNSSQKAYFLSDADLDWGQDDLRLVKLAQERGWSNIKLAGFAGADPKFYGMDWHPWTVRDLQGPQPGSTYLIDTSFFQLAPAFFPETAPIAHGWIANSPPTGRLNDTWYYFEVPGTSAVDPTAKINSVPSIRYYWEGEKRVGY